MSRYKIFSDDTDLECAALGEVGWHSKAIARETGLSEGQVNYRLHAAGVKRSDYRNGTSDTAQEVVAKIKQMKMRELKKELYPKFHPNGSH